jgi:hypothetical protein
MRWLAIMLSLFLAGCSLQESTMAMSTPEERALAERALTATRAGDYARMEAMAEGPLHADLTPTVFATIRGAIPDGETSLLRVVIEPGPPRVKTLIYEIGRADHWALVQVSVLPGTDHSRLIGITAAPSNRSQAAANAFSFKGKPAAHYVWLLAMAGALLISITAFVQIVRTPGLQLKWLWAIGSLISVFSFTLDWTTGKMHLTPWGVVPLGIHAAHDGPLGPWMLTFAIPVVALAFLLRASRAASR